MQRQQPSVGSVRQPLSRFQRQLPFQGSCREAGGGIGSRRLREVQFMLPEVVLRTRGSNRVPAQPAGLVSCRSNGSSSASSGIVPDRPERSPSHGRRRWFPLSCRRRCTGSSLRAPAPLPQRPFEQRAPQAAMPELAGHMQALDDHAAAVQRVVQLHKPDHSLLNERPIDRAARRKKLARLFALALGRPVVDERLPHQAIALRTAPPDLGHGGCVRTNRSSEHGPKLSEFRRSIRIPFASIAQAKVM